MQYDSPYSWFGALKTLLCIMSKFFDKPPHTFDIEKCEVTLGQKFSCFVFFFNLKMHLQTIDQDQSGGLQYSKKERITS